MCLLLHYIAFFIFDDTLLWKLLIKLKQIFILLFSIVFMRHDMKFGAVMAPGYDAEKSVPKEPRLKHHRKAPRYWIYPGRPVLVLLVKLVMPVVL